MGFASRSSLLTRIIRRTRARFQAWTPGSDRTFHDQLFEAQSFDPFCPGYPGRLTILRFADAASARIQDASYAIDLGCGSGEITCELARRHPGVRFLGMDHSQTGIERARGHAARLGLGNVEFEAGDVERFEPSRPVSIAFFFDSFHHLADPRRLIARLGRECSKFLCIEPAGDWKGSWRKGLDFDWLVTDLDKIRSRVAEALGEPRLQATPAPEVSPHGAAIENRYSLPEFAEFFDGFSLEVSGTVAGLETYPPAPHAASDTRAFFNRIAYDMLRWVDEELTRRDLDLLGKHWVIYAERGPAKALRRVPATPHLTPQHLEGPFDVEYLSYEGPRRLPAGSPFNAKVRLRNRSWRPWSSSAVPPVLLSYHWLDAHQVPAIWDGERTSLPRSVGPGEECTVLLSAHAPPSPGRYFLAVELVEEGSSWFSEGGVPWHLVPVRVEGQTLRRRS